MQINEVVDAIASKLHEMFGDGYGIYTESMEQGFKEPCFFIALLELQQSKVVGNRYHRSMSFDIQYFGTGKKDVHRTVDKLMEGMEYIPASNGDWLNGTNMKAAIREGVMHFLVHYNTHVYKEPDLIPTMGDITIETNRKRSG
ncbi:DUF6838 family protein [Sporosarcina sp. Te-1]|uniref:phage tail terminator family protein n=1 Tax=Sporosarcina sp. Te-1 TaxID=2818390 RepID=UPI001A9EC814|nr:hypothetical protein [Sporosarcina sp. Te-1]QTD40644.1 hypothetical protein J3U78_18060 [Sporosarcina sp. Te-1]